MSATTQVLLVGIQETFSQISTTGSDNKNGLKFLICVIIAQVKWINAGGAATIWVLLTMRRAIFPLVNYRFQSQHSLEVREVTGDRKFV